MALELGKNLYLWENCVYWEQVVLLDPVIHCVCVHMAKDRLHITILEKTAYVNTYEKHHKHTYIYVQQIFNRLGGFKWKKKLNGVYW